MSVNQYPVAEDVQDVAADEEPHGCLRVGDAVGKLLESIEEQHEDDGDEQHDVIRTHQGEQFLRLAQAMDVQVEDAHDGGQQDADKSVRPKRILQGASHGFLLALAEEASHDGGQPVGETGGKDDDEVEHVVYEAGCGQVFRAMMAYHQCVGKAEDDHAQLADDDGET